MFLRAFCDYRPMLQVTLLEFASWRVDNIVGIAENDAFFPPRVFSIAIFLESDCWIKDYLNCPIWKKLHNFMQKCVLPKCCNLSKIERETFWWKKKTLVSKAISLQGC